MVTFRVAALRMVHCFWASLTVIFANFEQSKNIFGRLL